MSLNSTVFVVGGDDGFREMVKQLGTAGGLDTHSFPSAPEFLAAYAPTCTGCVVLGADSSGGSVLKPLEQLTERDIRIPIIAVAQGPDIPTVIQAMRMGCVDFVELPCDDETLLDAIRGTVEHSAQAQRERSVRDQVRTRLYQLTPREREVMELVVCGMVNKEIAAELGISRKTVEAHRANVMRKMQAGTLAQLVRQAVLSGMFEASSDARHGLGHG